MTVDLLVDVPRGLQLNLTARVPLEMSKRQHRAAHLLHGLVNRIVIFGLLLALTFFLPRLMPGDPLELKLSSDVARELTAAETGAMREQMGLSGTTMEQFLDYSKAIARGDLGYSLHYAASVSSLLRASLPWTGLLVFGALPIYLLVGVGVGIETGRVRRSKLDHIVTAVMTVLASIPPFVAAVFLLLVFGILWPILPTSGAQPLFPASEPVARASEIASHAILPVFSLALHEIVRFYFLSRGETASLSTRAFLINARARGVSGARERLNYYGRNLLPVLLARMSDSITTLIGAVLYVEIVFSYPGVGHLLYDAILQRDYVLLQGAIVGVALVILTLNWVIDASIAVLSIRG